MSEMPFKFFNRNQRGRDFVVGDIHGHFSALEMLLLQVNFDPEHDRVFSVGDMIDRGPESWRVIEFLNHPWFHSIMGNHEQMLLDSAFNPSIDKNWVNAREKYFAHYTHLAPGNYVFQVQGSNNDGAWNEVPVEMEITILPPWWQTRFAWFVYFLMIALVIWRIYLSQAHSIRLKEQVALEQRESERMRALEQMKTNFFSNITHEFRTPLTLIIEPLRQVLKNPNADDWLPKVQLAARNSAAGKKLGLQLKAAREAFLQVVDFVLTNAKTDPNAVFSGSVPYLMLAGNLVSGWQLARALIVAEDKLAAGEDAAFMTAKIATARFYGDHILARVASLRDTVLEGGDSVSAMPVDLF